MLLVGASIEGCQLVDPKPVQKSAKRRSLAELRQKKRAA
jgi:hypothetical protein